MRTVHKVMAVVVFTALIFSRPVGASASPAMDEGGKENGMEFQKGYAPVDGLSMYYEIHGSAHADRTPGTPTRRRRYRPRSANYFQSSPATGK
jgi:hypothetical protein